MDPFGGVCVWRPGGGTLSPGPPLSLVARAGPSNTRPHPATGCKDARQGCQDGRRASEELKPPSGSARLPDCRIGGGGVQRKRGGGALIAVAPSCLRPLPDVPWSLGDALKPPGEGGCKEPPAGGAAPGGCWRSVHPGGLLAGSGEMEPAVAAGPADPGAESERLIAAGRH